jgi:DNA-binding MarR family transcriptional regulator
LPSCRDNIINRWSRRAAGSHFLSLVGTNSEPRPWSVPLAARWTPCRKTGNCLDQRRRRPILLKHGLWWQKSVNIATNYLCANIHTTSECQIKNVVPFEKRGSFVKKIKESGKSVNYRARKKSSRKADQQLALTVLMKFRLIVNSAKRHFKWVEKQCGINGAQLWVLWEINQAPGLRVSELAAAMAMHQSTASNLIEKLTQSKLITRQRASSDQRVVTLFLTEAGKATLKRAPRPARGRLPEALYRLPRNALSLLERLLERVLHEMRPTEKGSMKKPLAELLAIK